MSLENGQTVLWFNKAVISELDDLISRKLVDGLQRLAIYGSEEMGKREIVDYLISNMSNSETLSYRFDLSFQEFSVRQFIIRFLRPSADKISFFNDFLKKFSESQKKYIINKIKLLSDIETDDLQWYLDLLLEFLSQISQKKLLILVFENIDQLDGYKYEKFNVVLEQFQKISAHLIYTINPETPLKTTLYTQHDIYLSKLYIQTVETAIQLYFRTSTLNARLLTNHCYLKSGGNPFKIRLFLHTLYQPLIPRTKNEYLDLKSLQSIKIPDTWDELFLKIYKMQPKKVATILGFLAYLDEPISSRDINLLFTHFKIRKNILKDWIKSGMVSEVFTGEGAHIRITPGTLKKWMRNVISIKDVTQVLHYCSLASRQNKFEKIYPLSDLMFEIGEAKNALELALTEAEYFNSGALFEKAADRYYFAVRISELENIELPDLNEILEKLGNTYLQLGNYDNAFEILKRLRNRIIQHDNLKDKVFKEMWVSVNLKMAEALIKMDSYQEARYLITETKIKKFLIKSTRARCSELLGDIESYVGHRDLAMQHYLEASYLYKDLGELVNFNSVFAKIKNYIQRNFDEYSQLIQEKETISPLSEFSGESLGPIYIEKISILIQQKKFDEALKVCYYLENILREVYLPKIEIQLAFYFGEINVHMGKWHLALSHLNAANKKFFVLHRPELHIQVLLQIGLIYKEQAIYGNACKIFENAMQICFKNGLSEQMNEIKLHLGHIYLLVHGLMRAYDYLNEVLDWAEKYQKYPTKFLASLYLAFYEMQQNRLEKARKLLKDAKYILNLSMNPLDYFNYLFYLGFWLIYSKRYDHAENVIQLLQRKSQEFARYQAASFYLSGKLHFTRGNLTQTTKALDKAVKISKKWKFPHLLYLSYCELARISLAEENDQTKIRSMKDACQQIDAMTKNMGDEILGRQFLESKYHEDLISFCKEHNIIEIISDSDE
jgi:tetratricopeptide (TPR) repeat protein